MVEIDTKKSFRWNYDAGCSKEELMKYYCIKTEPEWDKLIKSLEKRKTPEMASGFMKKTITGKGDK